MMERYDSYKDSGVEWIGEIPSHWVFPPLSEQSQIVQFLDEKTSLIDSLIEKTKRKIELLKEERTSLINHTVTKGLNPNVEMKDSGVEWIGEIPSIHLSPNKTKSYPIWMNIPN
jgi:restriction endonuclease S subunit